METPSAFKISPGKSEAFDRFKCRTLLYHKLTTTGGTLRFVCFSNKTSCRVLECPNFCTQLSGTAWL